MIAALGRNGQAIGKRRQRLSDSALALAARVEVCRVDVVEAGVNGFLKKRRFAGVFSRRFVPSPTVYLPVADLHALRLPRAS